MRYLILSAELLLAATLLAISGCTPFGVGASQQPEYYVLNSLYASDKPVSPMAELNNVSLGVGPVRFPRHLDRKEIVTRTGNNQVTIDDFALWAGPLSENFNLVLAENLSIMLDTKQVAIFPWRSRYPIQYQVTVHVTRFDSQPGKQALLRVRWVVLDAGTREILYKDQSTFTETASGSTMEAMVAAKSRALAHFSSEIARAIIGLEKRGR